MNNLITNIVKINLFFILYIFFCITCVFGEEYDEIIVEGNERLSVETVIMFSGLKLGEDLDANDLNTSVKKLYKTDYFKDIDLSTSDKIITIKITCPPS